MRDSRNGEREPEDRLLQSIPEGTVGYRAIDGEVPVYEDFLSHHARGNRPNPTMPYRAYEWVGVSLFLDEARAARLVRRMERGRVVPLTFRGGIAFSGVFNERTSHLEVFAPPQDLLNLVDS
jgi:hypothetical protein